MTILLVSELVTAVVIVNSESVRQIASTLSALAQEKQKLSKVRTHCVSDYTRMSSAEACLHIQTWGNWQFGVQRYRNTRLATMHADVEKVVSSSFWRLGFASCTYASSNALYFQTATGTKRLLIKPWAPGDSSRLWCTLPQWAQNHFDLNSHTIQQPCLQGTCTVLYISATCQSTRGQGNNTILCCART